ncbi:MAG: XrtA/PEP-CTERM system histidine kinase PrsK [Chthoniobacterales bacterium]
MNLQSSLAFAAATLSVLVGVAVVLRTQRSVASWSFAAGMLLLALDSICAGLSLQATAAPEIGFWQTQSLLTKAFLPFTWICFSLTYSRGNYREFLLRSRLLLVLAFVVPVTAVLLWRTQLIEVVPYPDLGGGWWLRYQEPAKFLNSVLLIASVFILMNVEKTFRSAVGTMQWRIKFVVIGIGVIFGARIYTRSQALLFSGHNVALLGVDASALLIGCFLICVAYIRAGFSAANIYPSRTALHTSVTVLLVGGYLLIVGVLAQLVARFGGSDSFQFAALLILLAMTILAVILLSGRFRQNVQRFVSRHFKRPQHDFRRVWTLFTRNTSGALTQSKLCAAVVRLISETFNALSVTIWLIDQNKERLTFGASTFQSERVTTELPARAALANPLLPGVQARTSPFDLESAKGDWVEPLKQLSSKQFDKGGNRICVPLVAGEHSLGLAILSDRVNGIPYTAEEMDLLKCIGDQVGASLLNLRLTGEILLSKELEAFRTLSAFFVHDLKNAASTLSLTLQNLPTHFADPEFREDALRGMGKTVGRINELIGRLSVLRQKLELNSTRYDLNALVEEVVASFAFDPRIELIKELTPLPEVVADREQIHSVVTNLLLNARDALERGGQVRVETRQSGDWAALSVADNGCGMSSHFLKESLFRPFQTTKKKGIGIGMFQTKMIVEAHRGTIQVSSEPGIGTTFRVLLPLEEKAQ